MDTEQLKRMAPEQLGKLLYQMVLIRLFEEKTNEMYHQGHIGGYCHLYIGEEAVAVGALNALRKDDYVIGAYRDHGHAIIKGSSPRRLMAELLGKPDVKRAGGDSAIIAHSRMVLEAMKTASRPK